MFLSVPALACDDPQRDTVYLSVGSKGELAFSDRGDPADETPVESCRPSLEAVQAGRLRAEADLALALALADSRRQDAEIRLAERELATERRRQRQPIVQRDVVVAPGYGFYRQARFRDGRFPGNSPRGNRGSGGPGQPDEAPTAPGRSRSFGTR